MERAAQTRRRACETHHTAGLGSRRLSPGARSAWQARYRSVCRKQRRPMRSTREELAKLSELQGSAAWQRRTLENCRGKSHRRRCEFSSCDGNSPRSRREQSLTSRLGGRRNEADNPVLELTRERTARASRRCGAKVPMIASSGRERRPVPAPESLPGDRGRSDPSVFPASKFGRRRGASRVTGAALLSCALIRCPRGR